MKRGFYYNSILAETREIKKKYCVSCVYFKDKKCELKKTYKKCFKSNLKVEKSLDI